MANNPLYPGYSPKKEGDSINPLYPGYYTGNPITKRPDWRGTIPPAEYEFDVLFNQFDEVGDKVSKSILVGPKWVKDRIVDDWKGQLKVSVSPEAKLETTELDDLATDDLAGATATLSLNPKDWGIGHEKGFEQTKKQLKKTLNDWYKETTGINRSNLLESDFSDIQNAVNEKLWTTALGYGEEESTSELEEEGGEAIADRTTAFFKKVKDSAYVNARGEKLNPLDLKHRQIINDAGETSIEVDRMYEETAKSAAEFIKSRDDARNRDKQHTAFISSAVKEIRNEINDSKLGIKLEKATPKQKAAIELFNNKVKTLETIERLQKDIADYATNLEKESIVIKDKWRTTSTKAEQQATILSGADILLTEKKEDLNKILRNLEKTDKSLIPEQEISFLKDEIKRYNSRIDDLSKTVKDVQENKVNIRNAAKNLRGATPGRNFTSRTTFQDGLGGNLRKDLEKSVLGKKDHDIGSVINAEGSNLRAKKIAPVMYRLKQERVHYAAKEVLDSFDKGGLAQVAETYAWKAIKNRLPATLERITSGGIVGDTLQRTNYFGLKIDPRGTPTDEFFDANLGKKARFERKFLNKTDVTLDEKLVGLVGEAGSNKIRVTGADVHKDRLEYLENLKKKPGFEKTKIASLNIIGDSTLKRFRFDKSTEDQILFARLINRDRSDDTLEKLSQKMFGYGLSELTDKNKEDMGKFFTKIDYANNWVYQKSGGKIKALEIQRGYSEALGIFNTDSAFFKAIGMNDKEIEGIVGTLGYKSLKISKGDLDIFKHSQIGLLTQKAVDQKEADKLILKLFKIEARDGYKGDFLKGEHTDVSVKILYKSITGKDFKSLSLDEQIQWTKDWAEMGKQINAFSEWILTQRSIFGDKVDDPTFRLKLFMQFKKQGVEAFKAVNVDQNDKSFLLIKNIFDKNKQLNPGYRLNDKRYLGRLEKINNKMQSLQKLWNKSPLGRLIKFIKNWQEIVSEKIVALLSKLIAKLVGITAASLGPLAALLPILQAIAEKVVKKVLNYGVAFINAIFKFDFRDLDKMFQEDLKKVLQLLGVVCCCQSLLFLPGLFIIVLVFTAVNPFDNTRKNVDGYGGGGGGMTTLPTSGEPDQRVFGCNGGTGNCNVGECVNSYTPCGGWFNNLSNSPGIGGFYYHQCDPGWGGDELGLGPPPGVPIAESICSWGCAMTSIAMISTYFGHVYTPRQINNMEDGVTNRFNYQSISDWQIPDVNHDSKTYPTQQDLVAFFQDHPDGEGIIALGMQEGCFAEHWVVITGMCDDDFIMYDPYSGPDGRLSQVYPSGNNWVSAHMYWVDDYCIGNGNDDIITDCGFDEAVVCGAERPAPTGNQKADLALDIACNLRPGFECLYNRPLFESDYGIANKPLFYSGNVITAPGQGDQLFDFVAFAEHPNTEDHGDATDLFWCTWLPIKVYNTTEGASFGWGTIASGNGLDLGAYNMCDQIEAGWNGLQKRDEPQVGDIVCYNWNHVGIVYSFNEDYVNVVESNGYPYNSYAKLGPGQYSSIRYFGGL